MISDSGNSEILGKWQMVAAMTLSGTIGLFVMASGQPAMTVVLLRCLIGGISLLALLYWQGGWKNFNVAQVKWLLLGAAALIINWLCLFSAYKLSSISIATVVYHVQPFFLLILLAMTQKDGQIWRKLPFLLLAFAGVVFSSGLDVQHDFLRSADGHFSQVLAGAGLALLAALLYAFATLATRKLQGIAPAQIAGLQLLVGAVVLAPMADLSGWSWHWQSWGSLVLLGFVHTGLMYKLMYDAFQKLPATSIATLSFIYPLVALLVDVWFFSTVLSAVQLLGMAMILIAVLANQRDWNLLMLMRTLNLRNGIK
ncbi:MAG: DMT family transporter [Undibacterium umbellatum]|uniref:DMT family transporter n=1 Tax=Undibacterium umbellatum TaxID=2762300 RepID=UPI003BB4F98C